MTAPPSAPVVVLPAPSGPAPAPDDPELLRRVRSLTEDLAEPGPAWTQRQRVALLEALEVLKNVCSGTQATVTVDLDEEAAREREATQHEIGHRRREREGVTAEVALARRVSPQRSRALIDLARALGARLPHTQAALRDGRISEWAASIVVTRTKDLTDEEALAVDTQLLPVLGTCSERRLEKRTIALVYEADKRSYLERAARATEDRHVSVRPVADGMVRLSALLPLAEGVAVYAALDKSASAQRAAGCTDTRAQLRADELVRSVTGTDPRTGGVPVEIGLVMTDRTLFGDGDQPGRVPGYGPVPAVVARMLAAYGTTRPDTAALLGADGGGARAADGSAARRATAWVRRLFTDPVDGSLAQMDTRRRLFASAARRFVLARDQECATPCCDARIRTVDHVDRARDDGPTTAANGQGLCEACNLDKETEDLTTTVVRGFDGRRAVRIRTRYGQTHHTSPPPVLDSITDLVGGWHGELPPWWARSSPEDEDPDEWCEDPGAWADEEAWAEEQPWHEGEGRSA